MFLIMSSMELILCEKFVKLESICHGCTVSSYILGVDEEGWFRGRLPHGKSDGESSVILHDTVGRGRRKQLAQETLSVRL